MTDNEKIRAAWEECPSFPEGQVWRVSAPVEPLTTFDDGQAVCTRADDVVEFRHERGLHDGRRARRILGKLGDTEIQVAFAYI